MHTPSRVVAGLGATALLALTACTADADSGATTSPSGSPTATVTVTTTASPTADDDAPDAVQVQSSSSGTTCYDRPYPDLAWLDVTYEVMADVTTMDVSLVDSVGVRTVGPPVDLPPVNVGGTVAFGGEYVWADRAKMKEQRQISWAGRSRVDLGFSPFEGRTGLLMFHLRFDDDVLAGERAAELGTIRVTWSGEGRPDGEVEVPVEQTISFSPADCR